MHRSSPKERRFKFQIIPSKLPLLNERIDINCCRMNLEGLPRVPISARGVDSNLNYLPRKISDCTRLCKLNVKNPHTQSSSPIRCSARRRIWSRHDTSVVLFFTCFYIYLMYSKQSEVLTTIIKLRTSSF